MVRFQKEATGTQAKIDVRKVAREYATITPIKT
jgi:hypothetical protein